MKMRGIAESTHFNFDSMDPPAHFFVGLILK
jgi:hypothetical protein